MKMVVLQGSPNKKGSTHILADCFRQGAEAAGHTVEFIDVAHAKIHPCTGCVHCGYEGPCVQKDDVESIRKKILGDEEPIDCRPADLIPPELEKLRAEFPQEYYEQEEDILTMAMFPQVAPKFFESRKNKKYGVDGKHADKENLVHPV